MTVSDFPNAWPAITLDFRNSRKLDPRITFTRATTATETGNATGDVNNGLVRTFPQNVPRLVTEGLLLEQESTNEEINSQAFSNWLNNGGAINVTDNAETAPDGTQTASTLANTNTANAGRSLLSRAQLARTGQQTAQQLWIRRVSGTDPQPTIRLQTIGGGPGVEITPTNEWQQIISIQTTLTGGTFNAQQIDFTGNWDTAGTANNNVYAVWGSQIENNRSFATSYIATNGTAVTRAADLAVIEGADFTNWYNGGVTGFASTWVVSGTQLSITNGVQDGVENPFCDMFTLMTPQRNSSIRWGALQAHQVRIIDYNVGTTPAGVPVKLALAYGTNFVSMAVQTVLSAPGSINPNMFAQTNELRIGRSNNTLNGWNGTIAQLSYYPIVVPDDGLEALTA